MDHRLIDIRSNLKSPVRERLYSLVDLAKTDFQFSDGYMGRGGRASFRHFSKRSENRGAVR